MGRPQLPSQCAAADPSGIPEKLASMRSGQRKHRAEEGALNCRFTLCSLGELPNCSESQLLLLENGATLQTGPPHRAVTSESS